MGYDAPRRQEGLTPAPRHIENVAREMIGRSRDIHPEHRHTIPFVRRCRNVRRLIAGPLDLADGLSHALISRPRHRVGHPPGEIGHCLPLQRQHGRPQGIVPFIAGGVQITPSTLQRFGCPLQFAPLSRGLQFTPSHRHHPNPIALANNESCLRNRCPMNVVAAFPGIIAPASAIWRMVALSIRTRSTRL